MVHQEWFADDTFHWRYEAWHDEEWIAPAKASLPIETKLIAACLGIGLLLVVVLAAVNHVYSVTQ
jgi:hypothetical protein